MSREAVEAVIGKAVVDAKFRAALFSNPTEAFGKLGSDAGGSRVADGDRL